MKHARIPQILLLALLASAAVWAAPPADARGGAAPVAASGAYTVQFNLKIGTQVPAGATIACRARITPNLGAFGNLNQGMHPVQAAPVRAAVTGSSATCALEIPFSWMMMDPRDGAQLSYEIDAVSGGQVTARLQQSVGVSLPPQGQTANLRLDVRF